MLVQVTELTPKQKTAKTSLITTCPLSVSAVLCCFKASFLLRTLDNLVPVFNIRTLAVNIIQYL